MNLSAARVWVTGASTGIGAALVGPLLVRGARVAITARRAALLEAIAHEHARTGPTPPLVVPADVTDRSAVNAAARQITAALGGIDLAVFNAGGHEGGTESPFCAEPFVATMALNYFSVVYGLEAVLPDMLARGSGRVAAVASLAGYRALPGAASYSASKAAVIHLLESLRFSLEPHGVGVTVVNPGFVRTPLTDRNRFHMPFLIEPADAAERIIRGIERDRLEIHFPPQMSWPMKLMRILPFSLYASGIRRATRHT